ncbi:carbohydrate ABC transporter permease [Paenibacillus flagellatus]|uniref:Sugar ABC transporter permease n=1 Tax=Paenibacillus flagellatus TaxID=2211139 RepID=A0A2V5KR62_9BACL|nr:sugar ABC transporter permease [Paenibacillus flagellatus]PYI51286.1 sugar ABC transporter permease [Paenibacillus flagellatus]
MSGLVEAGTGRLPRRQRHRPPLYYPILFAVPALIVYLVFFFYPTVLGFYYSFTDWNATGAEVRFVGVAQFAEVVRNPDFANALKNTFLYAAITTIGKNVIPLGLAVLLTMGMRSRNALRAVYFSPAILNIVAVGLIFQGLLNPHTGFVNNVLRSLNLDFLALGWIGDPSLSIYSACLMEIWRASGITMAIYIAGIQNIPSDYYEAAAIDGASAWSKFIHVTLPLLMPAVTINVLLSVIYGARMFEGIYFLTQGGPGNSSEVLMTLVYKYMGQGLYGYSTALNLILVLLIVAISMPLLSYMQKREAER